jgi:hypothetical protein
MPDRRAAEAAHAAIAHGIGEVAGVRQFRIDFRRQLAALGWMRVGAAAQRDVQHGAAFGGVDGLPGEHGVALRLDASCARASSASWTVPLMRCRVKSSSMPAADKRA